MDPYLSHRRKYAFGVAQQKFMNITYWWINQTWYVVARMYTFQLIWFLANQLVIYFQAIPAIKTGCQMVDDKMSFPEKLIILVAISLLETKTHTTHNSTCSIPYYRVLFLHPKTNRRSHNDNYIFELLQNQGQTFNATRVTPNTRHTGQQLQLFSYLPNSSNVISTNASK